MQPKHPIAWRTRQASSSGSVRIVHLNTFTEATPEQLHLLASMRARSVSPGPTVDARPPAVSVPGSPGEVRLWSELQALREEVRRSTAAMVRSMAYGGS
jgi:hypothetical protein